MAILVTNPTVWNKRVKTRVRVRVTFCERVCEGVPERVCARP